MSGMMCISGGVEIGERQKMESMAAGSNLRSVFAMMFGNYLADPRVPTSDCSGKRKLMTVSDGPWFYARMPQGRYTIKAVHHGKKIVRTVETGPAVQGVMFN